MNGLERWIRYIGYGVIALFLLGFFVPFVGITVLDAIRRNPHAVIEMLTQPGCWIIIFGPILFWASLVVFYWRLPKEARGAHVSEYRRGLSFRTISALVREYRRLHGYDWLIWVATASGLWTLVLIALLLVQGRK